MSTANTREHVFWHELRAPAGTLVTLLDVMSQGFAGEAPPELRDLVERAKRQADRLMEMLAAAHDLQRLRWGTLAIHKAPLELGSALRAAAAAVDSAARTRGTPVQPEIAEPVQVAADPVLLARCLESLLRAAIEASAKGGAVAVRLSRREGMGLVAARLDRPVDAGALEAAFTQESSLGIRGGTGLGLYEVKLLVEAMGGSVSSKAGLLELGLPES